MIGIDKNAREGWQRITGPPDRVVTRGEGKEKSAQVRSFGSGSAIVCSYCDARGGQAVRQQPRNSWHQTISAELNFKGSCWNRQPGTQGSKSFSDSKRLCPNRWSSYLISVS